MCARRAHCGVNVWACMAVSLVSSFKRNAIVCHLKWKRKRKINRAVPLFLCVIVCVSAIQVIWWIFLHASRRHATMRAYSCDTIFEECAILKRTNATFLNQSKQYTIYTSCVEANAAAWALQNCTFYLWSFQWTVAHEMALQSIRVFPLCRT